MEDHPPAAVSVCRHVFTGELAASQFLRCCGRAKTFVSSRMESGKTKKLFYASAPCPQPRYVLTRGVAKGGVGGRLVDWERGGGGGWVGVMGGRRVSGGKCEGRKWRGFQWNYCT